jgi:signal transduction histidine kinase
MRPGRYVLVAVSDTGTGMDELTQRRVLEPFFTTKGQGNALGLGLLQVRSFAEQCGGYVRIDSAPGQGTNVQLYLPHTHGASALVVPHQQSA